MSFTAADSYHDFLPQILIFLLTLTFGCLLICHLNIIMFLTEGVFVELFKLYFLYIAL